MQEKVGFCGLYCGSCTMYRAFHDQNPQLLMEAPKNFRQRFELDKATLESIACDGCRSAKALDYCASCEIRKCAQKKQLDWCFECDQFPCRRLYHFESFWRMPITLNLIRIREMGIEQWMAKTMTMWSCHACDAKLHWFSFGICPKCGFEIPDPVNS